MLVLTKLCKQQCAMSARIKALEDRNNNCTCQIRNRQAEGDDINITFPVIKTLEEYEDVENHPKNLVSYLFRSRIVVVLTSFLTKNI